MNVSAVFRSFGSTIGSCASSAGTAIKDTANGVVQTGKMGFDKTVTVITNNPKTAAVTALAIAASLAALAYTSYSGEASGE